MVAFLFHPVYTDVAMKIIFSRSAGSYERKDKKEQTVYKFRPQVEYATLFWDLGRVY